MFKAALRNHKRLQGAPSEALPQQPLRVVTQTPEGCSDVGLHQHEEGLGQDGESSMPKTAGSSFWVGSCHEQRPAIESCSGDQRTRDRVCPDSVLAPSITPIGAEPRKVERSAVLDVDPVKIERLPKGSFGSSKSPLPQTFVGASFSSIKTDFDGLTEDPQYLQAVLGHRQSMMAKRLAVDERMPVGHTSSSGTSGIPHTSSGGTSGNPLASSFVSSRGGPSFGSEVTDFDDMLCPGAQAEHDQDYREAISDPKSVEMFLAMARQRGIAASATPEPVKALSVAATASRASATSRAAALVPDTAVASSRAPVVTPPADFASADVSELKDTAPDISGRTTIMLRNLPNDYTRDMTIAWLDSQGFKDRYDFIYLPVDFKRWANFGYAFVNMRTHNDAESALARLNGFSNWLKKSAKVCHAIWGEPLQGFEAHVERYRNSPVMHPDVPDAAKPIIFEADGSRGEFPPPLRRLKAPRGPQMLAKEGVSGGVARRAARYTR